jgi:uncharacterized sulfatase
MKLAALTLALLVSLSDRSGTAEGRAPRLNVLFIVVDDLNTDLGCYGHGVVKSPNIDRLAARGVRFDRSYCQYAVCAPSRWSFLSGLRAETTGIYDFQTLLRQRIPEVVFLPQLFRQSGYFAAARGKVFHDERQSDSERSWDSYKDRMGEDAQEAAAVQDRYRYREEERPWGRTVLDGPEEKTRDGIAARAIASLITEKSGEGTPFFLAAGFHKPHLPWTAPAKYFDLYPSDRIPLPPEPPLKDVPPIALMTELAGNPGPRSRAEAIAAYYGCISFVDAQVGVLLDALDRLRLWDNTVVLLLGDNGYHLGDHGGLWSKLTNFEQAARIPLLIAAPGQARGKSCARTVELLDLYPTLAELCGLQAPARIEGRSLAPLLRNVDAPWERPAHTMVHHRGVVGKSIRNDRWRYTEWEGGKQGAELYDHDHDPTEVLNLAGDPAHAQTRTFMKQLLEKP